MGETEVNEYRPGQAWFSDLLDAQAMVAANERFLWFSLAQAGMALALHADDVANDELEAIVRIFEKDVADYREAVERFFGVLDGMLTNAKVNAGLNP